MVLVVDLIDVFYALIKEFKKCLPGAKHYLGSVPEGIKRPSLLYLLVFNGDTRVSMLTKDVVIDLQIIYFGESDQYTGLASLEDKLNAMAALKGFLGQFNLTVKDRNLKFSYSFSEADGELVVNIQFKFKDGVVNLAYDEEQAREMIERIYINEKEVI